MRVSALVACLVGVGQSEPITEDLPRPAVVVSQGGFRPDLRKRAVAIGEIDARKAQVHARDGRVVLEVQVGEPRFDSLSGEKVRWIDFSGLTRPGTYTLVVDGRASEPFPIHAQPYEGALRKLLRSYYLQRCGVTLDDAITGLRHDACHTDDGTIARSDALNQAGSRVSVAGGWHDAGDYGKYVATFAVTVARLLFVYEQAPRHFGDDLGIPESGNGTADILDEARVGLDWIMAMQRADGAVYRKVSGRVWSKGFAPDQDRQPRFVFGVSTPETGKAAAVLAQAARVYRGVDPAYSQRCLAAARKAWAFLAPASGQMVDWAKGDDSGSGKYLESRIDQEPTLFTDEDDRLAAAAELWMATGEREFHQAVDARIARGYNLYEWKDASILPLQSLMLRASPWSKRIRADLLTRARQLLARGQSNGYGLANERLVWGSNKMTAEEGITLALAHRLTGLKAFLDAAADQVAYLLGRNPFGLSFVTGVGTRAVVQPCHLWGQLIDKQIPGLLVGGPNPDDPSGYSPKQRGLLSYRDDNRSYGTNEYAVDYNSALIGLLTLVADAAAR